MEEKRSAPGVDLSPLTSKSAGVSLEPPENGGRAFVSRLFRSKWQLIAFAVGFALLGLIAGSSQADVYTLKTAIEIHRPTSNESNTDSQKPSNRDDYLQTQARLIESRQVVTRAVVRLADADRLRLTDGAQYWWTNGLFASDVESICSRIKAEPARQAALLNVFFRCSDAASGTRLLNALARELGEANIRRAWREAQYKRDWSQRRLKDLDKRRQQAERTAKEFALTAGLQEAGEDAAARTAPEEAEPKLRQLKNRLTSLKHQLALWESLYGSQTPTVRRLKQEALALSAEILRQGDAASGATVLALRIRSERAVGSRTDLLAHLQSLRGEAETDQQAYEYAIAQVKREALDDRLQDAAITVSDSPSTIIKQRGRSQFLFGAIGGMLGLLSGVFFVGFRTEFSRTFLDPGSLRRHLGVRVLGAIPIDNIAADKEREPEAPLDSEAVLHLSFATNLAIAEAYRSVRTSVLFRMRAVAAPRCMLFTSAVRSERKTSVVGNLGAALAIAERRVLVVDGNLQAPILHRLFGATNNIGLAEVLLGKSDVRQAVRATQIPGLYLLAAGQAGADGAELMSSAELPILLRQIAQGFDFVLVDSPPALGNSAARSLAQAVDEVVLIVRSGFTSRTDALVVRELLSQDGAQLSGAILTEYESDGRD